MLCTSVTNCPAGQFLSTFVNIKTYFRSMIGKELKTGPTH